MAAQLRCVAIYQHINLVPQELNPKQKSLIAAIENRQRFIGFRDKFVQGPRPDQMRVNDELETISTIVKYLMETQHAIIQRLDDQAKTIQSLVEIIINSSDKNAQTELFHSIIGLVSGANMESEDM